MRATKASFSLSGWGWTWEKKLPEPEAFCAKPRSMTGFLATLSEAQKKAALEYKAEDTHGDVDFAR